MAKYLVETYYTCSFKVTHYLENIDEKELTNLEKRDDGKFEILDVKLDNRKTKNLNKTVNQISNDSKKNGNLKNELLKPKIIANDNNQKFSLDVSFSHNNEYFIFTDKSLFPRTSYKYKILIKNSANLENTNSNLNSISVTTITKDFIPLSSTKIIPEALNKVSTNENCVGSISKNEPYYHDNLSDPGCCDNNDPFVSCMIVFFHH